MIQLGLCRLWQLCTVMKYYTEHRRSSIWQLCRHWWHRKLSLRQLTMAPVTTKLSNLRPFVFSSIFDSNFRSEQECKNLDCIIYIFTENQELSWCQFCRHWGQRRLSKYYINFVVMRYASCEIRLVCHLSPYLVSMNVADGLVYVRRNNICNQHVDKRLLAFERRYVTMVHGRSLPRQNCRHFGRRHFQRHFLEWKW